MCLTFYIYNHFCMLFLKDCLKVKDSFKAKLNRTLYEVRYKVHSGDTYVRGEVNCLMKCENST